MTTVLTKRWPTDKPRYEAEWFHSQQLDKYGEWDPDRDEYHFSYHSTKEEAEKAAIAASKAAPAQTEWVRVAETRYEMGEWVTYRSWSGDWDGLESEPIHELASAD